ncbi:unnamed protein product, partial [Allacma fusca]
MADLVKEIKEVVGRQCRDLEERVVMMVQKKREECTEEDLEHLRKSRGREPSGQTGSPLP